MEVPTVASNVFDRPPAEWTDDEIRAGLAEVARSLEFHTVAGDTAVVDFLHAVAVELAEHRDARRALYRDVTNVIG